MPEQERKALDHILAQTRQNILLLATSDRLSSADADLIISKLDNVREGEPLPPGKTFYVKIIWPYNENAQNPSDLSLRKGDIIEIVQENNKEWWTGRTRERTGLVPVNHVEKIGITDSISPPRMQRTNPYPDYPPQPPPYPSGMAPYLGHQPGGPVQPYPNPIPMGYLHPPQSMPPQPAPVYAHQVPLPQPQQQQGSGIGHTLATAAVGGLGWGAGTAVGSDIVNRLF